MAVDSCRFAQNVAQSLHGKPVATARDTVQEFAATPPRPADPLTLMVLAPFVTGSYSPRR